MGHVATSHDSTADDSVVNARTTRRTETARILEEASRAESPERRKALHDEVIRLNMQVAGEIARRYHGRGIPGDDLDQVANLGLVKAVQGFDPSHGSDFLSFAVPTIRGEIRRYFRDFGWTIRPPRSVQELQTKITAAEGELFQSLGRSPRPSEIARHARCRRGERSGRPARRGGPRLRERRGPRRAQERHAGADATRAPDPGDA